MGYAALFSGGKDSSLALYKAQSLGLDVDHLVTVHPERDDSYMFHKPNLHLVPELANSLGIELIEIETSGKKESEVEDLKEGVKDLDVSGLIAGAVASSYQMDRIESLSSELGLDIYAPLWNKSQSELLQEILENGFRTIIVSVSALGLDKKWLGKEIDEERIKRLKKLHEKYGINISGEGGEYETLVLDGPDFDWEFDTREKRTLWDGRRGKIEIELEKKEK